MTSNLLSSASILERMADALPTHEQGDTTSDLSSSLDAVALFTHACMASLDFKLLGFSEEQKIASECANIAPRIPAQWNKSLSSHSFVYSHPQSSMQFVIRVDRLGGKIEIRGLGVGDERIARFEITARDYISSAALPLRIPLTEDGTEVRGEDLQQKLKNLFISPERITDLASLLKISIIQRLLPNLQKPGYQESENPDDRAARQDADSTARSGARPTVIPSPLPPLVPHPTPYPLIDPLAEPPRRPLPAGDFPPPDFDDEYEVNRPPRGLPGGLGLGGGRFGIGGSDLYPAGLGPDDPLRASFVPGRFGGQGGSGGMHPTFDDPLFQGPRGQGNPQFDPQVPPGARWDPLGPGGAPRFGGGRPGGNGQGGFGSGFGGDII
ncbi:PI31 proteasome regulator N-terminal-domain-containing protein [Lasiosphaeria hispida]|uniref:PI31 proteasome regulator N-terminal-domain-containing protein n=1 Tax=Lasiosphaeria hispida TaxID=260671 RepID=A0AAJ0HHT7_9PEZI|nr:PI31 proteasome regulator N-terminal-domain-containing protein [Lasiosphaeria hispida]